METNDATAGGGGAPNTLPADGGADTTATGGGGATLNPPIPPPIANPTAPTWVMIVGAVAGLITLLGFAAFAVLAGVVPQFVCNSLLPLSAVFAFGAALAVSFIGGAAAINGRLGGAAQTNALAFSATGGIAVLLIAFFAFQQFAPKNCGTANTVVSLENLSSKARVVPTGGEPPWSKTSGIYDTAGVPDPNHKIIKYLVADADEHTFDIDHGDGSDHCVVHVLFVNDINIPTARQSHFEIASIDEQTSTVKLEYRHKSNPNKSKSGSGCITIGGNTLIGYLAVSPGSRTVKYGTSVKPEFLDELDSYSNGDSDVQAVSMLEQAQLLLLPTAALAEAPPAPFADIAKLLRDPDPNVRVAGRQFLSSRFDVYSSDVVAQIADPRTQGGDYLASLLSALISGIDTKTGGRLAPGQKRDLSTPLPYIAGQESRIVELTGHPDAVVRKQARRLIQRFPVDAFAAVYNPIIDEAYNGKCDFRNDMLTSDALLYSAIFFEYNVIIQHNSDPEFTSDIQYHLANLVDHVVAGAQCLPEELRIDTALLYFGLATLYNEAGNADRDGLKPKARAAASQFLTYVAENGGEDKYYLQSHVEAMRSLAG